MANKFYNRNDSRLPSRIASWDRIEKRAHHVWSISKEGGNPVVNRLQPEWVNENPADLKSDEVFLFMGGKKVAGRLVSVNTNNNAKIVTASGVVRAPISWLRYADDGGLCCDVMCDGINKTAEEPQQQAGQQNAQQGQQPQGNPVSRAFNKFRNWMIPSQQQGQQQNQQPQQQQNQQQQDDGRGKPQSVAQSLYNMIEAGEGIARLELNPNTFMTLTGVQVGDDIKIKCEVFVKTFKPLKPQMFDHLEQVINEYHLTPAQLNPIGGSGY